MQAQIQALQTGGQTAEDLRNLLSAEKLRSGEGQVGTLARKSVEGIGLFLDVWPFYIPSLWLQQDIVESLSCSECKLRYFPFLLDVLHQESWCLPGLSLAARGTDWVVLGRHLNSDFRVSHACLWNGAWHTDILTGVSLLV